MAPTMPRWRTRKLFKGALLTVLGALLLVFALLLALIAIVHTDWGRDQIVQRAEGALAPHVRGELTIGRLGGSPLGRFTLEDVLVRDEDGRVVLAVDRATLNYAPGSLLRRHLRLTELEIEGVRTRVRIDEDGRVNLAEVFDFPEPDPDVEPMRVSMADVTIKGGAADVDAPQLDRVVVSDLALRGGEVDIDGPDQVSAALESLSAEIAIPEQDLETAARASGRAALEDGALTAEAVELRIAGSSVQVPELVGDEDGALRGRVEVALMAEDLDLVAPDSPWIGDARLAGSLSRPGADAPVAVDLEGDVAGAKAALTASVDPEAPGAEFELEAAGADPSRAVRDAPDGSLDFWLRGWARGDPGDVAGGAGGGDAGEGAGGEGDAAPAGYVEISARGDVAGWRVDSAEGTAQLAGDAIAAEIRGQMPGARVRADGELDFGGPEPVLTRSAAEASITDLRALSRDEIPAQGRADITLRAEGPLDALAVRGDLSARDLRAQDVRIASLSADIDAQGVPSAPEATARVEARDLRIGEAPVSLVVADAELLRGGEQLAARLSAGAPGEPYGASGRATVDLQTEPLRADIHELAVRTRELLWRADDTAIAVSEDGEVDIERLDIASQAGQISARGQLRGEEAGDLDVTVTSLDVGRTHAALFPDEPRISGQLTGRADVVWPPARGQIEGQLSGLRVGPMAAAGIPAADVDLSATLEDGRALASIEARAGPQSADVEIAARAPDTPTDLEAWEALGERAIESLTVELRALDLGAIAEALGAPHPQRGRADVSAALGAGLETGTLEASVDDFAYGEPWPTVSATASASVEGNPGDRELRASAAARAPDGQRARAEIAALPPADLLDVQAWADLDFEAATQRLLVDIEDLQLAPLADATDEPPFESGLLSVRARLGEGLERGTVSAEPSDFRAAGPLPAVDADAHAEIRGREADVAIQVLAEPLGWAEITAAAQLPADRFDPQALADLTGDALRAAEARGEADAGELSAAFAAVPSFGGELSFEASAEAGLREARLRADARRVSAEALDRPVSAELDAQLSPDATRASIDAWMHPPGAAPGDATAPGEATNAGARGPTLMRGDVEIEAGAAALSEGDLDAFIQRAIRGELLARAPLGAVRSAVGADVPVSGVIRGMLEVSGSIADPDLTLAIDSPDVTLAGVGFDELRGITRLARGEVRGRLRARQESGHLEADARIPLDDPGAGVVAASARDFDLAFLAAGLVPSPAPVLDVGGRLSASLEARPDLGAPELEGYLRIDDASLDVADFRPIRDGTVFIEHADGLAEIQLQARSDRGTVAVTGEAELDGLEPTGLSVNVNTDEFPIAAVPEVPIALDLDAQIDGTRLPTELWRFDVEAERVIVNLPETDRYRRGLGPVGELEDVRLTDEEAPEEELEPPTAGAPLALIRLHTPNDVLVRGEDVNARIQTDLRVTLLEGSTSIEGSIATVRGDVRLFDRRYEIENARVAFEGRIPPDPRIDVRLSHQFATMTLFIDATGTADNPSISFSSDPGIYDQAQLLSFVLGGNPDTGAEPGTEPGLQQRAVGAAGAMIAEQVGDVLRQAFPIDVLRIGADDPAEGVFGFVTVGTWVRDDLFVAYRRRADPGERENIHEAQLEYQLFQNWTLEGVAGRERQSVDLLWIRRY